MYIPGERFHFTYIFSRLLVYLTFDFVYLDIKQKEKGRAILSSLIWFFLFRNCRNTSSRTTADLPSVPRVEMGREG